MLQPSRPAVQCGHQRRAGLSSSSIRNNLQQRAHDPQTRPGTTTMGSAITSPPAYYFTATSLKVNVRNITPDASFAAGLPPETHSSSAAASSRVWFAGSRSASLVMARTPFDLRLKEPGKFDFAGDHITFAAAAGRHHRGPTRQFSRPPV